MEDFCFSIITSANTSNSTSVFLRCRNCEWCCRNMTGTWKTPCMFCRCSPTPVGAPSSVNCAVVVTRRCSFALVLFFSFISADNTCFSSPEMEEKKPKKSRSKEKSGKDNKKKHYQSVSESEESADDSDAARHSEDSEDSDSDKEAHKRLKTQSSASTLLPWITKGSESASSLPPIRKTTSTSSTAQMLSQFASGTSIAKKQAAESKRKARASDQHVSSDEENDPEDTLSSEFEDSDEELSATEGMTGIKTEVVKFFQTASVDEMSLISGCSVKKAQKIVELRPFDSWRSLVRIK